MPNHLDNGSDMPTVHLAWASSNAATGSLPDGSRVLVLSEAGCGRCNTCQLRGDNFCASPVLAGKDWTATIDVERALVLPLPPQIADERAVLIPFVARITRALRRSAEQGEGPVGIIAETELHPLAVKLGAHTGIEITTVHAAGELNRALHLSSQPRSMEQALLAIGRMGFVFTSSLGEPASALIPEYYHHMIVKESAIVGTGRPSRKDVLDAVEFLARGLVDQELVACTAMQDATSSKIAAQNHPASFPVSVTRLS
ncbi:MAG: hypothetical protein KF874_14855 [Rhizobiaceae bacterium]|nr:hypothetical protein [Rhizobiaceae bacterium]